MVCFSMLCRSCALMNLCSPQPWLDVVAQTRLGRADPPQAFLFGSACLDTCLLYVWFSGLISTILGSQGKRPLRCAPAPTFLQELPTSIEGKRPLRCAPSSIRHFITPTSSPSCLIARFAYLSRGIAAIAVRPLFYSALLFTCLTVTCYSSTLPL